MRGNLRSFRTKHFATGDRGLYRQAGQPGSYKPCLGMGEIRGAKQIFYGLLTSEMYPEEKNVDASAYVNPGAKAIRVSVWTNQTLANFYFLSGIKKTADGGFYSDMSLNYEAIWHSDSQMIELDDKYKFQIWPTPGTGAGNVYIFLVKVFY